LNITFVKNPNRPEANQLAFYKRGLNRVCIALKMSRMQRHLLAVRELTFTAARERCIADELESKANKKHMGEPVSEEANKIQDLKQENGQKRTSGRRSTWNKGGA